MSKKKDNRPGQENDVTPELLSDEAGSRTAGEAAEDTAAAETDTLSAADSDIGDIADIDDSIDDLLADDTGNTDGDISDELEEFPDGADGDADTGGGSDISGGKNSTAVRSRKLRYGGVAIAITAAAVAMVILINVVASVLYQRFPFKFDITPENLYTLSDENREIVKAVDKEVKINIFFDEDKIANPGNHSLDENQVVVLKQFYETLIQYKLISGNKITYAFQDLDANPLLQQQYADSTTGDVLFQCTVKNGDGTEKVRSEKITLDDLLTVATDESGYSYVESSDVERVMASSLLKVTSSSTPVVLLLTGFDEDESTVAGLEQMIKNSNYTIEQHNISGAAEIPEEAVMAIIPAPLTDYDEAAIERLDKWMSNDGSYNRHLVVIANIGASCPNLYKKVKVEYDIEITSNLIIETDYNNIFNPYNSYPYYVYGNVTSNEIAGVTAGGRAAMPATLQLVTTRVMDDESSGQGMDLITFPESAQMYSMEALAEASENDTELEPFEADKYPISGMAYAYNYGYKDGTELWETKVLVCGSNAFFDINLPKQVAAASANEKLFLSLINDFTGNEVTVQLDGHYFKLSALEFSSTHAQILGFVFIVFIPLVLIACGVVVFIWRRRL